MRHQGTIVTAFVLGIIALAVAAGPLSATQANGSIAVIDNARVFDESNQGKAATQQIQANVDAWQQQLVTLETELTGLMTQRQQQASIMTPEALRTLEAQIEEKQIALQRRRDDAQRDAGASQNAVLAELEGQLTPVVEALAQEMGFTVVFNSQTPGLLHFNPTVDITDALIARLNSMDQ